jgi:hypothetical protein
MLTVHLTTLDPSLAPEPCEAARAWYDQVPKTNGHARHCPPLRMANTAGWAIRSPCTFAVEWDGDWKHDAVIEKLDDPGGLAVVDAHAAPASFTVQPGFVPRTSRPYEFVWVKSIPNILGNRWTAMEAVIEAWWSPGLFGVVCLLHRPGRFVVNRGDPIAQMVAVAVQSPRLVVTDEVWPEHEQWKMKRHRGDYRAPERDYDRGLHPDGSFEETHVRKWPRPGVGTALPD